MEFKVLSDQLNSALEDVATAQGVWSLQDQFIPEKEPISSEPGFLWIKRIYDKISWDFQESSFGMYSWDKEAESFCDGKKEKMIIELLSKQCGLHFHHSGLKQHFTDADFANCNFIGKKIQNKNWIKSWKICACKCGENFQVCQEAIRQNKTSRGCAFFEFRSWYSTEEKEEASKVLDNCFQKNSCIDDTECSVDEKDEKELLGGGLWKLLNKSKSSSDED
eukprot:GHVP01035649.1.p1 GENE.GHVP01035649.1~~GHVP01035649.1.p1  ORF type:complete len:232 (-),score=35.63 GHVP01035649.1:751-1413(-)